MKIDSNIGQREFNLAPIGAELQKRLSMYKGGRTKGYETLQNLVSTGSVSGANLKKIKNTMETDPNAKALFGDRFYNWVCSNLASDRKSGASSKQMHSELGLNTPKTRNKYQMKPQGTKVAIVANNDKGVRYMGESDKFAKSTANSPISRRFGNLIITESQYETIKKYNLK